jgi:hypothetical protein
MFRTILLLLTVGWVDCTCYSYLMGDTYFNDSSILNSSYCGNNLANSASIIQWPISDNTIANYAA